MRSRPRPRRRPAGWSRPRWRAGPRRTALWVRVNPGSTGLLVDDLEAVVVPGLDGIIIPKAESAADVATVDALLGALERSRGLTPGSVALIATIETAAGTRPHRRDRRRKSPDRLPRLRRGRLQPRPGPRLAARGRARPHAAGRQGGAGAGLTAQRPRSSPRRRVPRLPRARAAARRGSGRAGVGVRGQARDPPRSAAGDRGRVHAERRPARRRPGRGRRLRGGDPRGARRRAHRRALHRRAGGRSGPGGCWRSSDLAQDPGDGDRPAAPAANTASAIARRSRSRASACSTCRACTPRR